MECPVQCGCNAHAAPFFSLAGTAVKASGTGAGRPVDVCFARTGTEWRLPQQAENRIRVTKALLAAEEWILKKSFKIWKNFRLILFVSWSRI